MKHDSLGRVSQLLVQRESAAQIIEAARDSYLEPVWLLTKDTRVKVLQTVVPEDYVRQAIIEAGYDALRAIDKELNSLGVSTPKIEDQPETLDAWRRAAEMYLRVWVRELGGSLYPKRHLIDSLALTTERMRKRADLHEGPVVPKAEHDRRVQELLEANNEYLERARVAERALKAHLDGSPAERLALAVARTAAETIAAIRGDSNG
ncbi:hypothetical protein ACIPUD_11195 [Bradyrhizobium sp. CAR08]